MNRSVPLAKPRRGGGVGPSRIHLPRVGSRTIVSVAILVKVALAVLTPLGYDFALYISAVVQNNSSIAWAPWIIFVHYAYSFWLSLPIDHGDILRGLLADPTQLLPSHYLLTGLVKAPLVFSDVAAAFLIYRFGTDLVSRDVGHRAAFYWLLNPFATFFVEMWGSIDILAVTLGLASIFLIVRRRSLPAAASICAALALAISSIVTWLGLMAWVVRRKRANKSVQWDGPALVVACVLGFVAYAFWVAQGQAAALSHLFDSGVFYAPVVQYFGASYWSPELFFVPLWLTGSAGYYLLASRAWPRDEWAIIPLALSGVLLVYGLVDLLPTAFLWAMPLMALWNAKRGRFGFTIALFSVLAIFMLTFYNVELTSTSLSVLFIPRNLVPFGKDIIIAIQSLFLREYFSLPIRSALVGCALAYSVSVAWSTLRQRER